MRRTTVMIPDDLDARLRHEAKRRAMTMSEVTREALEAHLGTGPGRRRLRAVGIGKSGSSDTSTRVDEILGEEWSRARLVDGEAS
jgi:hypothetical protein